MLLSADPVTRVSRKMYYAEHDDTAVVVSEQDSTDIEDANRALFNSFRGAWERHAEYGDLYARIPLVVWGDLISKGIAYDDDRFAAWLDDQDNKAWRTRPGRIGRKRLSMVRLA